MRIIVDIIKWNQIIIPRGNQWQLIKINVINIALIVIINAVIIIIVIVIIILIVIVIIKNICKYQKNESIHFEFDLPCFPTYPKTFRGIP